MRGDKKAVATQQLHSTVTIQSLNKIVNGQILIRNSFFWSRIAYSKSEIEAARVVCCTQDFWAGEKLQFWGLCLLDWFRRRVGLRSWGGRTLNVVWMGTISHVQVRLCWPLVRFLQTITKVEKVGFAPVRCLCGHIVGARKVLRGCPRSLWDCWVIGERARPQECT